MQPFKLALLFAVLTPAIFYAPQTGQAHKRNVIYDASDVAHLVIGRICSTPSGATFDFGQNGEYRYDGLWKSDGHYKIYRGTISVAFHSGLERSFIISIQSGALMLEGTPISCKGPAVAHLHE